jgi:primosomal protein N' (replication factor Y)
MYILNVIPLIKIPYPNPQILSYFGEEKIKIGGVVKIPIRKKKINAIVVDCKKLEQEKIRLKKFADFQIKPIEKIISEEPILIDKQIKLLFWISDYYFAPMGLVARIFLSKKLPLYTKNSLILTPKNKGIIFSPFKNLESITIEDESSDLYRSWGRKPYYDVRTIAKQLAKIHNAKLTLKIARPRRISPGLKNSKLVDMREEMKNGNFSIISRGLQEALNKADKSILYIARRGTATFILCRECGYVSMCPDCDVPMIYHEDKPSRRLVCHHCGKDDIAPVLCPKCKSIKIKYFGAGTQKVESEIKKLFPDKRIFRLDSDVAEKLEQQQKIIQEFNQNKNAILIGSQMLLNKGLKANLVAIISIETILNLPDFKSSERVFQTINLLQKMAKNDFLIQTYKPDNFAIKTALANDFKKFYDEETKIRKAFNYPPFSQIIKLSFEHKDPITAKNQAKILMEKLKTQIRNLKTSDIELFGPVPAFIPKVARIYRWNIIIKSSIKDLNLRNRILIIVPSRWEIEVDPETVL